MRKHFFLLSSLLALGVVAAATNDIKVWIPSGSADTTKEQTNKQVVVGGWLQDPGKAHWQDFMVPEFLNHDPDEPRVGAQALVDLMRNGMSAGTINTVVQPGTKARPRFFVIADGDYVAIAHLPGNFDLDHPQAGVDPGATVGGNVFHVVNGKITEWWYYPNGGSGPGAVTTSTPQPGADKIDVAKNSTRPGAFGNTPLAYAVQPTSNEVEAANKKLVAAWLKDFWVDRNYSTWSKYMNAAFRNHDVRLPAQGAQALATWLQANPNFESDYADVKGVAKPQLFMLAEGDLVFVLGSPEAKDKFDPQAQIGVMSGNIIRVQDGKVAEWWHIGSRQARRAAGG